MFSCFTCGTDSLTNKLLKKSLKNVKPKTKKALTTQQAHRLPAQPHNIAQEIRQSCAQPSCLGGGCGQRPVANRALVHPDSPIQQEPVSVSGKSLLRDRADAAQLQLARESFINALTSALEVASRDKEVVPSEVGTPTSASSGPSSPTSRTLSLQRSLSGDNSDGASSGDESDGRASRHGSTHDSCISWQATTAAATVDKPQKGFTVVQVSSAPAQAEILPEPLSSETNVAIEPLETTRMLRVRTAFESFKSKRAQLRDVEESSPKEVRNAAEELAWARQAMDVSRKLQQTLPSTGLPAPMRQELEDTTAELEASAVHALSESDSDDDTIVSTPRELVILSSMEQAEIEATLAARNSGRASDVEQVAEAFSDSCPVSAPASPLTPLTPADVQPARCPRADFARITDVCLSNIRTMAATTAVQLEQEDDLIIPHSLRPTCSAASKISATCSAGIANASTHLPQSRSAPCTTSFPQTAAQTCCNADPDAEMPAADTTQLTCICSMIAELQLSDVLRCPKCQPRPSLASAPSLSAQKPPRHPGRAYRAASLQRLRVAASC